MKAAKGSRGVAYIALGPKRFRDEALHSLSTLRRFLPDVPAVLFTDTGDPQPEFSDVVRVKDNIGGHPVGAAKWNTPGWLARIDIFATLPFERTIFIDTDTEVVGDIANLFDLLDRFDVAAAHAPYRLQGDIAGVPASFPEFNCGLLCIRKSAASAKLLTQWRAAYLANPQFWHHDQHTFRQVAWASDARIAVLPPEYNLRPARYTGQSAPKVLHGFRRLDVPETGASGRKIRFLSDDHGIAHHRSGWEYALAGLRPLTHPGGVVFDSMIENTFGWHLARYRDYLPMREPWIGVAHNPPNIPEGHFDEARPQALLQRLKFRDSLASCLGLFALSDYHAKWLRHALGKPVEVLYHPVGFDVPQFDPAAFARTDPRSLIHIGWWLRRFESFNRLDAGHYNKYVLRLPDKNAHACIAQVAWNDKVEFIDRLPDNHFDKLLTRAVVFADLIDCSANNVVIDCIARATPLLINRHPALEEYLGADYPLFYDGLGHAEQLLRDDDAVIAASRHMRTDKVRAKLSLDHFRESMQRSDIYRSLPPC